ncbi:MAG TPA: porin [Thermodesulfobacteriota bacterium]|nr:porin [Thermodesulfobacteriota bacterium]
MPAWVAGQALPAAEGEAPPLSRKEAAPYRTPLAGEPYETTLLGEKIDVPARDRGNISSVNLGLTVYSPNQGDTSVLPMGAYYLRGTRDDGRLRMVVSGFVNEVDASVKVAGMLEAVGRYENFIIPFGEYGIADNQTIKGSAVQWGTLSTFLGLGVRAPAAPYQYDNGWLVQLLGRVGYLYSDETRNTDPGVRLPPDTFLYGARLRGGYDGIRRNLMDLPHAGKAFGFDFDAVHRAHWGDYGNNIVNFTKGDTQDYYQFAAYAFSVMGIPGFSEKNRFLASLHVGVTDTTSTDRYNAFRLTGGPFAAEALDLRRPNYPGALYGNTRVANYTLANFEYRRELLFFLYLHLRATFIWAQREVVKDVNQIGFKSHTGQNVSAAVTTGFFWGSQIFLQAAWDSGFLRDGVTGTTFTVMWSKAFR